MPTIILFTESCDYQIDITTNDQTFSIISKIQDLNLKQDFEFTPSTTQTLRFGAQAIYHTITPGYVTATSDISPVNATPDRSNFSLNPAAYEYFRTLDLILTTNAAPSTAPTKLLGWGAGLLQRPLPAGAAP